MKKKVGYLRKMRKDQVKYTLHVELNDGSSYKAGDVIGNSLPRIGETIFYQDRKGVKGSDGTRVNLICEVTGVQHNISKKNLEFSINLAVNAKEIK